MFRRGRRNQHARRVCSPIQTRAAEIIDPGNNYYRAVPPLLSIFGARCWMFDLRFMISSRQILGIKFFNGNVDEAVASMVRHGGFLVAPSGTCFARLRDDEPYRRAMFSADVAIADSGLMVVLWRLLRCEKVTRISGLQYLRQLLAKLKTEGGEKVFWALPSESAREKLLDWSRREAFSIKADDCYCALRYGLEIEDRFLLARIEESRPTHVIIAIGSGAQEKLGHFLRENLSYRPAIHCIGAALGFITGDQVAIPNWADRIFLGWLFRLLAQPMIFIPRLARALELPWLIARYGSELPLPRPRD
jgi:N-acetylglucosaminyldiphosphoundecaprenol N-acetyl-beta-D-mannosaminyltransferase